MTYDGGNDREVTNKLRYVNWNVEEMKKNKVIHKRNFSFNFLSCYRKI